MARFTDVSLDWLIGAGTNDISVLYDLKAIKNSIMKILSLDKFDLPFDDRHHSTIKYLLFELPSHSTCAALHSHITWLLEELEPRITLESVVVILNGNNDGYIVTVVYKISKLNIVDTLITPLVRRTV